MMVCRQETEPVTMGGDPARGETLCPYPKHKGWKKKKKATTRDEELLRTETHQQLAAMASALCTFSLPSSSLSCSNQTGVSSFSSRCSDVLGDGSRPFHRLGCQTELADSTAGIVAQPRASKSPRSSSSSSSPFSLPVKGTYHVSLLRGPRN